MADPDLDRLREPPQQGARHLLMSLLDAAADARARLGTPGDAEALHDFRVIVRRLRSALRVFSNELGEAADKRRQRRWRDLVAATGEGRDAEAQAAWLEAAMPGLERAAQPAARLLAERLAQRRDREAKTVAAAARRFDRLAQRLREDLSSYTVRLDEDASPRTFGDVAAERVSVLASDLAARLAAVSGPRDVNGAHEARIAGKRLRYTLDVAAPNARREIGRLRQLQDELGELHDVHGLIDRAGRRAARQAEDRARRLAELLADYGVASEEFHHARRRGSSPSWWPLLEALRQRQDALYAAVAETWLRGGESTIAAHLQELLDGAYAESSRRASSSDTRRFA